jgi:hypothetical protein
MNKITYSEFIERDLFCRDNGLVLDQSLNVYIDWKGYCHFLGKINLKKALKDKRVKE